MALLIPADESQPVREVTPDNGSDFHLAQLYKLLDCSLIEVVPLPDRAFILVVDEESKLVEKPRNERATRLVNFPDVREFTATLLHLREAGVNVIFAGEPITDFSAEIDYIAGDALVCKESELR